MSVLTFAFLVSAVALALLVAPIASFLGRSRSRPWHGVGAVVAQLLPVALTVVYLQYAETHSRIPIFRYERPPMSLVFGAVALLQAVASGALLSSGSASALRKRLWVSASVLGAVALSFVATGVVACANGNCF